MKEELKGIPINKLIGLISKMYFFVSDDATEVNIVKRVNISIEFNEYEDGLFNEKTTRHKIKIIQSKKHKIGTYNVINISWHIMSCFDDKIYILNDGIKALAYFH